MDLKHDGKHAECYTENPITVQNTIYLNIKVLFKAHVKTFKYFTAVWTWRNKGNSFPSCAISGTASRNMAYKLFSHSKLKQACNKTRTSKNQMIHYHVYEGPLMNWVKFSQLYAQFNNTYPPIRKSSSKATWPNFVCITSLVYVKHPFHLTLTDLKHHCNRDLRCIQIIKILIMQFSPFHYHFIFPGF